MSRDCCDEVACGARLFAQLVLRQEVTSLQREMALALPLPFYLQRAYEEFAPTITVSARAGMFADEGMMTSRQS